VISAVDKRKDRLKSLYTVLAYVFRGPTQQAILHALRQCRCQLLRAISVSVSFDKSAR